MEDAARRLTASLIKILQPNIRGVNTPPGYMTPLTCDCFVTLREALLFRRSACLLHSLLSQQPV
jgi:hypothetical protein